MPAANQMNQPFKVNERTTALLSFQLQDQDGEDISLADLNTLTLTLYDRATDTIINARDGENVLNTNDVIVSSTGLVSWTMTPDDNDIQTPSVLPGQNERHIALFQWRWDTTKEGRAEIQINVKQITKVESESSSGA